MLYYQPYCNLFWNLHLQSLFVEHFSSLQDAAASGHCVLDDQAYVPVLK